MRGRTARAAEGLEIRFDDGEELAADALFLATGKHELRGLARPLEGRSEPPSAGLRAAIAPDAALEHALAGTIELHLFDGGYAGLLLQEDGQANVCLSVARARLSGGPEALLAELAGEAPLFAERLVGREADWEAVAGVPYGWRALETAPGCFRLGDQAAVIASLAGDGIAIALTSGMAAAGAMAAGGPLAAQDYQRELARRAARPLRVAEALRHAAESPRSRGALVRMAGWAPGLARLAARLTRIA